MRTKHYKGSLRNLDYIILFFTDFLGHARGRTIPAKAFDSAVTQGVGFDGSSIPACMRIEESDMTMKPNLKTFTVLPTYFYGRKVAMLICDIHRPGGKWFEGDPRYICHRAEEKVRAEGYVANAAAELEFYLTTKTENGDLVSVEHKVADRQRYFDMFPHRDLTETYRMDLSDALLGMGVEVERHHHEVGCSQSEITFRYSTPVATSDSIVRYKFATRAIAEKKYGWIATFMPKPWSDTPGSGMHVHLSLSTSKGERNAFFDPKGYASISQVGRYFIGGLLAHARALSAVVAPTVNSYKRLVPRYEAPVYVMWSRRNRSAFVRVPEYFPKKENEARIELRSPDPLCNPYLAYAALFEAGLDGIKKKIDAGDPVEQNAYDLGGSASAGMKIATLPSCLKEALEEWESDDICIRALGKENAARYRELKEKEWKEYENQAPANPLEVTAWELSKYLFA